ncbi:MAG: hypothetical protein HY461_01065 [Parcubacteria group bacterium]|nr:hypothetical protein [Parcubacteria group bacterium]
MPLSFLQYNILSFALLLPVIINLFAWQSPSLSRICGGVFLIFQSLVWGQWLGKGRPVSRTFFLGLLSCLTLLLLSATFIYAVWDLSAPAMAVVFLLQPLFGSLLLRASHQPLQARLEINDFGWRHLRFKPAVWALFIGYLVSLGTCFALLLAGATTQAIASPWQVVSPAFWPFLAVCTILILLIAWTTDSRSAAPYFISSYLFLLFSAALIVYQMGYGFDSFIHQAAEQLISSTGLVLPKTPYYLGQYSLITSLHHLLGISVLTLDRLLVPVMAAVSLPFLCQEIITPKTDQSQPGLRHSAWLALAVVLMPFASFIVTTPQGLANLYFVWIVLCSLPLLLNTNVPWNVPMLWIMAASAVAIHPISGIPAVILVALISLESLRDKLHFSAGLLNSLYLEIIVLGSLAIPAAFLIFGLLSGQTYSLTLTGLSLEGFRAWWPFDTLVAARSPRSLPFELGYYVIEHGWWLLTAAITPVVLWLLARHRASLLRVYVLAAIILVANAVILSVFIHVPNVIAYEVQQYPLRLLSLAFWSLLPFLIIGLLWLYRAVRRTNAAAFWIVLLGLTWLIVGNVYISYPRHNRYEIGRQYSTSAHDREAVQKIAAQNSGSYVVLANQSVSAAAIAAQGFKTYFPDPQGGAPIFYYPVPTSSPLYRIYLDMVYDRPSREHAEQAQTLTGASTVYFILNDYWDNAANLKALAKMEADEWTDIGGGRVTVFTYRFGQ